MKATKDIRGLIGMVWLRGNIKIGDEVQVILPSGNKMY